jgi:hypothetical protein
VVAVALAVTLMAGCSVSSDKNATSSDSGSATAVAARHFATTPKQGVTKDTVTLGVAMIDFEKVKEQYGVDLEGALPDGIFDALAASVNNKGGIHGRKVVLKKRLFMPIGTEDSEKSCRELTEDDKVFAVMGAYLGDNALCVTETHAIPYFSAWGLNPERQQRSKAPYLTTGNGDANNASVAMKKLIDNGTLEHKKVAVFWDSDTPDSVINTNLLPTLEGGGVKVVSKAKLPQTTDAVQAGSDFDRIMQRFQADGADTVVFWSGMGVVVPGLQRLTSYHPKIIFTNGQAIGADALTNFGLTKASSLDGAILVVSSGDSATLERDPGYLVCIKAINDNSNLNVKPSDTESKKENPSSKGYGQLSNVCQIWQLTVKVLTAAGPNLSSQSIVDGLAKLKSFSVTAIPHASLSPTKWTTGAPMRTWHYDHASTSFVLDK